MCCNRSAVHTPLYPLRCTRSPVPAGHARVYVAFDVLYRFLRQLGYDVTYVRNFTGAHSTRAVYSALYSCFLCEWPLAAPVAL